MSKESEEKQVNPYEVVETEVVKAPIELSDRNYDVIIVGAGAAGVGVGIALRHAGIDNFIILDRDKVGSSFARWPRETKFITPSFPTNSIGMLDLNSVALGISPALSIRAEHPTGQDFAKHLEIVAEYFSLPICNNVNVESIDKSDEIFSLRTNKKTLSSRNVIWAAGEFQYPATNLIEGGELCRHTATISSYDDLEGEEFIIIGGYESGMDAAFHLAARGREVRVFEKDCPWYSESSDPSVCLSTYTLERMMEDCFAEHVALYPDTPVTSVSCSSEVYQVQVDNGKIYESKVPPILAGGFEGSCGLVEQLFENREDGFPLLSEDDESTITSGLFLCGPSVRHDNQVFCFIYKYRQRFAVVAKAIASSLGLPAEELETYRNWGMYLDDLSCCGEDCVC